MATKYYDEVYEAALKEFFGDRLDNLSHETTEDGIKHIYDDWASEYDKEVVVRARGAWYKPLADYLDGAIKQVFQDKTKDQIKIVDVGAGTGGIGIALNKLGYTNLCALDISQEMLNEAKKKNVYKKFLCAALSEKRIPEIDTGEFDAMICAGTLVPGHVRSSALEEIVRMVKTGGLLCFNIREGHMNGYQEKMMELEKAERWKHLSKITVPYFENGDLPKETVGFIYKVLRH